MVRVAPFFDSQCRLARREFVELMPEVKYTNKYQLVSCENTVSRKK